MQFLLQYRLNKKGSPFKNPVCSRENLEKIDSQINSNYLPLFLIFVFNLQIPPLVFWIRFFQHSALTPNKMSEDFRLQHLVLAQLMTFLGKNTTSSVTFIIWSMHSAYTHTPSSLCVWNKNSLTIPEFVTIRNKERGKNNTLLHPIRKLLFLKLFFKNSKGHIQKHLWLFTVVE